jgi:hypothetical protein
MGLPQFKIRSLMLTVALAALVCYGFVRIGGEFLVILGMVSLFAMIDRLGVKRRYDIHVRDAALRQRIIAQRRREEADPRSPPIDG